MITLEQYFMGRDLAYSDELTDEIRENATTLLQVVNDLTEFHYQKEVQVSSGWRPPSINAATPGAAKKSCHMTGEAVDIRDSKGELQDFLMANQKLLED